jgi:hypothetical protein
VWRREGKCASGSSSSSNGSSSGSNVIKFQTTTGSDTDDPSKNADVFALAVRSLRVGEATTMVGSGGNGNTNTNSNNSDTSSSANSNNNSLRKSDISYQVLNTGWVYEAFRVCFGCFILLQWWGMLYYLQCFHTTGPLVRMILTIAQDMKAFLLIFIVGILGLHFSFYVFTWEEWWYSKYSDNFASSSNFENSDTALDSSITTTNTNTNSNFNSTLAANATALLGSASTIAGGHSVGLHFNLVSNILHGTLTAEKPMAVQAANADGDGDSQGDNSSGDRDNDRLSSTNANSISVAPHTHNNTTNAVVHANANSQNKNNLYSNLPTISYFNPRTTSESTTHTLNVMFILVFFIFPIILLNLLIAVMGDSYGRIAATAEIEFHLLRAQCIVEQELVFSSKELNNERFFPRFLHVLMPAGIGNAGAGGADGQILQSGKFTSWGGDSSGGDSGGGGSNSSGSGDILAECDADAGGLGGLGGSSGDSHSGGGRLGWGSAGYCSASGEGSSGVGLGDEFGGSDDLIQFKLDAMAAQQAELQAQLSLALQALQVARRGG